MLLPFFYLCHFLFNTKSTRVPQTPIAKILSDVKRHNYCLNVKTNMDPIFQHPVFDSVRKRVKCVIKQLEKPQETFKNSLHTCFKCGSNNLFSAAKQVRSADGGTSVFKECRDCHNKWRNG